MAPQGVQFSGTKRRAPDADQDPVALAAGKPKGKTGEFTMNLRPRDQQGKTATTTPTESAPKYHLDSLIHGAGDAPTARYGDLISRCNQIAAVIDRELQDLEATHQPQGAFLRTWLGIGMAKALQNDLNTDTAPARTNTAKVATQKSPPEANNILHPTQRSTPQKPSAYVATFAEVAGRKGPEPPTKKHLKGAHPNLAINKERRIMIRLDENNPTRKLEPFAIREQIRSRITDPSLVKDAWIVPSGITILAPSHTKAISLLQESEKIRIATGASAVERQEEWTTFLVGPIIKRQSSYAGPIDITADKVREEMIEATDGLDLKVVDWTKKSADPHLLEGHVRVCVASSRANRFPTRLRLFGRPVLVSKVKSKPSIPQCGRCFGFHHERNCAKPLRCGDCGAMKHEGSGCEQPVRCLNCRGPHASTSSRCPARPKIVDGRVVRLSRSRLQDIRQVQGRAYADRFASSTNKPADSPTRPGDGTDTTSSTSNVERQEVDVSEPLRTNNAFAALDETLEDEDMSVEGTEHPPSQTA